MDSHGMGGMNPELSPDTKVKTGVCHALWEKHRDKILKPFEELIYRWTRADTSP